MKKVCDNCGRYEDHIDGGARCSYCGHGEKSERKFRKDWETQVEDRCHRRGGFVNIKNRGVSTRMIVTDDPNMKPNAQGLYEVPYDTAYTYIDHETIEFSFCDAQDLSLEVGMLCVWRVTKLRVEQVNINYQHNFVPTATVRCQVT